MQKFNELTLEEKKVIIDKGTEKPFSGEYEHQFSDGLYVCRRCGAPLYHSQDKFEAGCGWPSFDDEIKGAIKRQPDADSERTEILCANCNAHLGHVFMGEKLTSKDTRHCVNSISMKFIPRDFLADEENFAVLGGGCFWCLEAAFKEIKGVKSVASGYAGGRALSPTYEKVSSGTTGHAEVIKAVFDNKAITFRDLLEVFFSIHDPTTLNRQGNDTGEQYRSIILYATLKQKDEAKKIIKELSDAETYKDKIVTEIKPFIYFYKAEEYHQNYFEKHKDDNTYCNIVINPKLKKFRENFNKLLRPS